MLTAIITRGDPRRLPALLAALTPAAVEGLVGDVWIVGEGALVEALCAETGAAQATDFAGAARAARSDWLLSMRPAFRPRDGWLERLGDHLRGEGGAAIIRGRSMFEGAVVAPRLLEADFGRLQRLGRRGRRL